MCGIAGIFAAKPIAEIVSVVDRLNEFNGKRGPDGRGSAFVHIGRNNLGLGHRRLAIIDLTEGGHQPMKNHRTGDLIIFNGEIYNYRELRKELASLGHTFRSGSDTEVILIGFEQWGCGVFGKLQGMFAIALFANAAKELLLVRDSLGIKPLYFSFSDDHLLFASSVQSLARTGLVSTKLDAGALSDYLAFGAVQAPATVFLAIKSLEPGKVFCVSLVAPPGALILKHRFWVFPRSTVDGDRDQALRDVRATLLQGVEKHLVSDVPVSLFLSSGLDSSAIAFALRDVSRTSDVTAFGVANMEDEASDESQIAGKLASHLKIPFRRIEIGTADVMEGVRGYWGSIDQPTVDGLNTYLISGAVRQEGFKVAMSGLGGDELFGGYGTAERVIGSLRWQSLAKSVPNYILKPLCRFGRPFLNASQIEKLGDIFDLPFSSRAHYFGSRRLFSDREINGFGLVSPSPIHNWQHDDSVRADDDIASVCSLLETQYYMGNMLLRDSDVFSMAHGLELRVPFLHTPLVSYVMALPGKWRRRSIEWNKPLLVDAISELKARANAGRHKRGFALSYAQWIRGPLSEPIAAAMEALMDTKVINPLQVWSTWLTFARRGEDAYWARVWALASLYASLRNSGVRM